MATSFTKTAEKQIGGVYDQQIKAAQSQIPAIQQLYAALTQGLQQQNQMQLESGTQGIVEDASARGVLRSTLPVDARQALTAQLGAALNQSLGQIGLEQAQQIGQVQQNIGGLRLDKASQIARLADALQTNDLEERKFKLAQIEADRDYQLKRQSLAQSGGGGASFSDQLALAKFQEAQKKGYKVEVRQDGSVGYMSPDGRPLSAAQYADKIGLSLNDVLSTDQTSYGQAAKAILEGDYGTLSNIVRATAQAGQWTPKTPPKSIRKNEKKLAAWLRSNYGALF